MMLKLQQRLMELTVLPSNQGMFPSDGAQLGPVVRQSFIAYSFSNAVSSLMVKN